MSLDDKTVRAGSQIISASDDGDKTVRAGTAVISADTGDATVRADSAIISASQNFIAALGSSDPNAQNEYILNDNRYNKIKTISESTGEAQVYLLERNDAKSVLKLYYPSIKPKDALIKKMRAFRNPNILQVSDYGYYQNRFFELMEFAAGGTLDQYQPVRDINKIREIIQETANALEFCHKNNIIHRDLKPANLFYKNSNGSGVLLGDFGISSILDEEAQSQVTGQARTMLYAAPELYQSLGGMAFVTKELDYYALGITLIVLWSNESPFKGFNELEVMRLKSLGKIALPEDMPDDLKNLVRGLTIVNIEKRWGYSEIQKWLRGDPVAVYVDVDQSSYKPFPFDQAAGLVANNPAELAKLLQDDPETGVRYLYRGRITKWLEESNNQKLAVVIEELYEKLYPKDEKAGLQAAIYILDPELPYKSIDGEKCHDLNDIVTAIENNLDDYEEALKKKNNPLFLYLETHGFAKEVSMFRKRFKSEMEHLAVLHVIYTLRPGSAFRFDGDHYAPAPAEIVPFMIADRERGEEIIYDGELETWLEYVDTDLSEKIENLRDTFDENQKAGFEVCLYTLDPDMPYTAPDKTECRTKEDLASALMRNFDTYIKKLANPDDNFYNYLIAHGFDNEVGAFRSFYHKDYNKGRFAYTTKDITLMKVIKGMNCNTPYVVNGKAFTNPQEMLGAGSPVKSVIAAEVAQKKSRLNAWISVFYHEDPFFVIQKTGDYESKLKEYVGFLGELSPQNPITIRFNSAVSQYQTTVQKEAAIDKRFIMGKIIALLLPVLSAVGLFFYVRSFSSNPLPGWFLSVSFFYHAAVIAAVMGFIILDYISDTDPNRKEGFFSTLFIGGPIIGLIMSAVIYYMIMITISIWPLLALILAVLIYVMVKSVFQRKYASENFASKLFDSMEFQCVVYEPLVFAFSDSEKFVSSKQEGFQTYRKARRKTKFQIARYCGIPTILMLTMMYMLYYYDPANMQALRPKEYHEKMIQDSVRAAEKQKADFLKAKYEKKSKTKNKTRK